MKFNLLPATNKKQKEMKMIVFYVFISAFIIFSLITTVLKINHYSSLKDKYQEIFLLANEVKKYENLYKHKEEISLKTKEINFTWGIILSEVLKNIPQKTVIEEISLNNNSLFLEVENEKEENIFLLINKLKESKRIKEILFNSKGRDKIEIKF